MTAGPTMKWPPLTRSASAPVRTAATVTSPLPKGNESPSLCPIAEPTATRPCCLTKGPTLSCIARCRGLSMALTFLFTPSSTTRSEGFPTEGSQHWHRRGDTGHLRDAAEQRFRKAGVGDAGNFQARIAADTGGQTAGGTGDRPSNTEDRDQQCRRDRNHHKQHRRSAGMPAQLAQVERAYAIDDHGCFPLARTSDPMRPSVKVITRSVDDASFEVVRHHHDGTAPADERRR